jgi:hypothetical protein
MAYNYPLTYQPVPAEQPPQPSAPPQPTQPGQMAYPSTLQADAAAQPMIQSGVPPPTYGQALGGTSYPLAYVPVKPSEPAVVIVGQPMAAAGGGVTVIGAGQADRRLRKVKDLLPLSIVTIFFCLIFGILATVFSLKVRQAKRHNDLNQAKKYNRYMVIMNVFGLFLGVGGLVGFLVLFGISKILKM